MCARHFHWVTSLSSQRIPRPPWDAARIFLRTHIPQNLALPSKKKTPRVFSCFQPVAWKWFACESSDRRRAEYFQFYAAERYEMSIWTGPGAWPNGVLCDKRLGEKFACMQPRTPCCERQMLLHLLIISFSFLSNRLAAAPWRRRRNANSGAKNWIKPPRGVAPALISPPPRGMNSFKKCFTVAPWELIMSLHCNYDNFMPAVAA